MVGHCAPHAHAGVREKSASGLFLGSATRASLHHLVDEEQLGRDNSRRLELLLLHTHVVDDAVGQRVGHAARLKVEAEVRVRAVRLTRVAEKGVAERRGGAALSRGLGEHLGDGHEGVTEGLHAGGQALLHVLAVREVVQVHLARRLEVTGTRDNAAVLDRVAHGPQTVPDRLLDLRDRVVVRALEQDGARRRLRRALNERVLLLAQHVLVHKAGPAERVLRQVVEVVDGLSAAAQRNPLHVPALGTAQTQDAVPRQDVERHGVNALLVHHNQVLVRARRAQLVLQLHNLAAPRVDGGALGGRHLLLLLSRLVVEARVQLRLLVLQRHVAGQDVAVLDVLRHLRVAAAVVEDQARDELGVGAHLVLHVHHLHHVQVDLLVLHADHLDGVDDAARQLVHELDGDLRGEGGGRDVVEHLTLILLRQLHHPLLQEADRLVGRQVEALRDRARVDALLHEVVRLRQRLANHNDGRRRAVAGLVVHRRGGARDEGGGGVLDLHLAEEHGAVLRHLDLAGTADKHLHRAHGSEVGLQNVHQSLGAAHAEVHGGLALNGRAVGVQILHRRCGCHGVALCG
eukprot:Rhum_TRINITY_DN14549_c14_g1::Rhum_TRINITY_DN14549_c14_g1_i1::g.98893::m.98893